MNEVAALRCWLERFNIAGSEVRARRSAALSGGTIPAATSNDVAVSSTVGVHTSGGDGHGLAAQSIGGGGGAGGMSLAGKISKATGGNALALAIGGSAGLGGNAGNVTMSSVRALTASSRSRSAAA